MLTPADRAKLLALDEKNRAKHAAEKLTAGKPLTKAERQLLAGIDASFAATWDDLARELGVTRRAILEWKKDPRYRAHCPRDRADGRKEVAAWLAFMLRHDLARAAEHSISPSVQQSTDGDADAIRPPMLAGSQSDWTKAVLHEKHAMARLDRECKEGTLLVAADLEIPLGATLAAIQTRLAQFPGTAARIVAGRRDVAEVEDLLRGEMDITLGELHAAAYLDVVLADLAADLPADEESGRLLKLVTFEGQDRAALLALIAHLAGEVLRRIGRRAIAQAHAQGGILDAETGQVTDAAAARQDAERATATAAAAPIPNASDPTRSASRGKRPPAAAKESRGRAPAAGSKKKRKPAAPPADVEALSQVASPQNRRWKKRPKRYSAGVKSK